MTTTCGVYLQVTRVVKLQGQPAISTQSCMSAGCYRSVHRGVTAACIRRQQVPPKRRELPWRHPNTHHPDVSPAAQTFNRGQRARRSWRPTRRTHTQCTAAAAKPLGPTWQAMMAVQACSRALLSSTPGSLPYCRRRSDTSKWWVASTAAESDEQAFLQGRAVQRGGKAV